MKNPFEKSLDRIKKKGENPLGKGELMEISPWIFSGEEEEGRVEKICQLFEEASFHREQLGIRLSLLLSPENRREIFLQYATAKWNWQWIWDGLVEDEGEEMTREFFEELMEKKEILREVLGGILSKMAYLSASAQDWEPIAPKENKRKILGMAYLSGSEGKSMETPYFTREDRLNEICLPLSGEVERVLFEGQRGDQPYTIGEDGWFLPKKEDRNLFSGPLKGEIL